MMIQEIYSTLDAQYEFFYKFRLSFHQKYNQNYRDLDSEPSHTPQVYDILYVISCLV